MSGEGVQLSPLELLVSEFVHEVKFRPSAPNAEVFAERVQMLLNPMPSVEWEKQYRYCENLFSGELSPLMPLREMLSLLGEEVLSQISADCLLAHTQTSSSFHQPTRL